MSLRILQVIPYFYPAWTYGGPVRVAYDVSKRLVKRGHEVVVYTSDANNRCSRINSKVQEVNGILVHYFRNVSMLATKEMRLFITPEMIPVVKSEIQSFDVVHLHEYRTFQSIVVHRYAKKHGVPYVLQAHGALPKIVAKQGLKWIYDTFFGYRLLKDASKVVAFSQMEAQQYRDMGVPEKKIEIIPNGIDLAEYGDLPPKGSFKKKFSIDDNEKIILYLGRIHKSKGIDFLIKSFARLIKNGIKDTKLVIAGADDGYLNSAKNLINLLGYSNHVIFTGPLMEEDRKSAYVDSTLVVYPSPYEPFGLVSLEVAVVSKPIIVSKGTYMSKIIEEGNFGFSVKYGDSKDLAKLLEFLVVNNTLASEMGTRGRQYVESNYSLDKVVDQMEKVYEGIQDL